MNGKVISSVRGCWLYLFLNCIPLFFFLLFLVLFLVSREIHCMLRLQSCMVLLFGWAALRIAFKSESMVWLDSTSVWLWSHHISLLWIIHLPLPVGRLWSPVTLWMSFVLVSSHRNLAASDWPPTPNRYLFLSSPNLFFLAISVRHRFVNPCGYPGMGKTGTGTGHLVVTRRKPTPVAWVWQVF